MNLDDKGNSDHKSSLTKKCKTSSSPIFCPPFPWKYGLFATETIHIPRLFKKSMEDNRKKSEMLAANTLVNMSGMKENIRHDDTTKSIRES